jgi:predicted ester cyclase
MEKAMTPIEQAALEVFAAINQRDLERIRVLVTENFVDHGAPPGLVPPGPDGYIAVLDFVTGVLDIRYEIHDVVAAGDLVAIRATGHGVHRSDHLGFPATGKPYAMQSMHLYRGHGDRLAEHWGVRDELGALYQVGALEPMPLPPMLTVD